MRIVIAGATKLGATLAKRLVEAEAEVVLIDEDAAALEAVADDLDCGMIHGDATLPSTLREAGGDAMDVLVALTHSDEDNILSAIVGRSIGFERVIPQIAAIELASICEELDLRDFITPDETIASSLISAIEDGRSPMRASPLCGDLTLASYEVEGALVGSSPADLDVGDAARLIAVGRQETDRFPDAVETLKRGDRLVILVEQKSLGSAVAALVEKDETKEEKTS